MDGVVPGDILITTTSAHGMDTATTRVTGEDIIPTMVDPTGMDTTPVITTDFTMEDIMEVPVPITGMVT